MKKAILILMILIIPAALFADVRVGPTAYYNFPLLQDEQYHPPELEGVDLSDFTFGADFRVKLFIFNLQATALFTPGASAGTFTLPASADLYLDGGLAFDLAILRLGVGVGPNFTFFFGDADTISNPTSMGMNLKATADLLLGPVSLGLSYLTQLDFDAKDPATFLSADKTQGLFGIAFMFKL